MFFHVLPNTYHVANIAHGASTDFFYAFFVQGRQQPTRGLDRRLRHTQH